MLIVMKKTDIVHTSRHLGKVVNIVWIAIIGGILFFLPGMIVGSLQFANSATMGSLRACEFIIRVISGIIAILFIDIRVQKLIGILHNSNKRTND